MRSTASTDEHPAHWRNQFELRKRRHTNSWAQNEEPGNDQVRKTGNTKLLVTLGGGGHSAEMLKLLSLLSDSYEYHYLVVKGVDLELCEIAQTGEIHEIRQPRGRHDSLIVAIRNSLIAGLQITAVMVRVRPHAIVGCGPAISVLTTVLGKLAGAKTIFVETASRVTTLSLTGKILYRISDLFFVQWPTLRHKYPKAVYAGRLK